MVPLSRSVTTHQHSKLLEKKRIFVICKIILLVNLWFFLTLQSFPLTFDLRLFLTVQRTRSMFVWDNTMSVLWLKSWWKKHENKSVVKSGLENLTAGQELTICRWSDVCSHTHFTAGLKRIDVWLLGHEGFERVILARHNSLVCAWRTFSLYYVQVSLVVSSTIHMWWLWLKGKDKIWRPHMICMKSKNC